MLEALAEAAREHDPLLDPRWNALAAGTLPAEEQKYLRELEQSGAVPPGTFDAFRPFSVEERAEITERDQGQVIPFRRDLGKITAVLTPFVAAAIGRIAPGSRFRLA